MMIIDEFIKKLKSLYVFFCFEKNINIMVPENGLCEENIKKIFFLYLFLISFQDIKYLFKVLEDLLNISWVPLCVFFRCNRDSHKLDIIFINLTNKVKILNFYSKISTFSSITCFKQDKASFSASKRLISYISIIFFN